MLRFRDPVGLARTHEDQAEVGGQRGIVRVDGVERKIVGGGEFDDFRAHGLQFVNEASVLRLGYFEVGGVMETEVAPSGDARRIVPSSVAWRTYKDTLEWADHGVAVEGEGGMGECGQRELLEFAE